MKRWYYILLFFFFLFPFVVSAKELEVKKDIYVDLEPQHIIHDGVVDSDGNFVLIICNKRTKETFLRKMDSSGNVLWNHDLASTFNGSSTVAVDSNNNIYTLVSYFFSYVDPTYYPEGIDIRSKKIVKYSSDGDYLDDFILNDAAFSNSFNIIRFIDGYLYVFGSGVDSFGTFAKTESNYNYFDVDIQYRLVQITTDGHINWTQKIGVVQHDQNIYLVSGASHSGSMFTLLTNVYENIILCGDNICANGMSGGSSVAMVSKNGELIWNKNYSGNNYSSNEYVSTLFYDNVNGLMFSVTTLMDFLPNIERSDSSTVYAIAKASNDGEITNAIKTPINYFRIVSAGDGYYAFCKWYTFYGSTDVFSDNGYYILKLDYDYNILDVDKLSDTSYFIIPTDNGVYVGSSDNHIVYYENPFIPETIENPKTYNAFYFFFIIFSIISILGCSFIIYRHYQKNNYI